MAVSTAQENNATESFVSACYYCCQFGNNLYHYSYAQAIAHEMELPLYASERVGHCRHAPISAHKRDVELWNMIVRNPPEEISEELPTPLKVY